MSNKIKYLKAGFLLYNKCYNIIFWIQFILRKINKKKFEKKIQTLIFYLTQLFKLVLDLDCDLMMQYKGL